MGCPMCVLADQKADPMHVFLAGIAATVATQTDIPKIGELMCPFHLILFFVAVNEMANAAAAIKAEIEKEPAKTTGDVS